MVVLYCTIVVPIRSRDSVTGDVSFRRLAVEITCCNYTQSAVALSHEMCSPKANSTSYELNVYSCVRDAIADKVVERTPVTFN